MRLQQVSLRGRRFLVQFSTIMNEFGGVIPWLDGVRGLGLMTNGAYFEEQLLDNLHQDNGGVTPYQFVAGDRSREFAGGLLHFRRTPERFRDHRNREIVETLEGSNVSYISCLQVLPGRRSTGLGRDLMTRALGAILDEHHAVWGVVSDPSLIGWYQSLGARVLSPTDNKDNLCIVTWKRNATDT